MTFSLGVVLFAVGIGLSIALHEFGHLLTAKAFGMKATQYFIGFGPTLFSFRRGETEYGLKAIPAGGFVKIVGMTPQEEDAEGRAAGGPHSGWSTQPPSPGIGARTARPEPGRTGGTESRAFWRYPAWKRVTVLAAGSVMHFVIALVAIYGAAVTSGLPTDKAIVGELQPCVVTVGATDGSVRDCAAGDPPSPAARAGLRNGDQITRVGDTPVRTFEDLITALRANPGRTLPVAYRRDGVERTTMVSIEPARRAPIGSEQKGSDGLARVGAIGVAPALFERHGPAAAVPASFRFTGTVVAGTLGALKTFPSKVPQLLGAVAGEQRDPAGPVSVVGVSRAGGQALEAGSVLFFVMLLAGFNIFVGVFNLFPLLPLDGGHIAIVLFEKVRSWIARALGRDDPGRVDYAKLMPLTMLVIVVFGGISLLAILADIVNPIANPFQ
jgi:membrane-associated protease RseP (regulator of RpoE activity)